MAHVFKPSYTRPIPDGVTRCKLKGGPAVRFIDERGKKHVRPIRKTGNEWRMVCEQKRYWMTYRLPDGTIRREKGYADKTATEAEAQRREQEAQQLASGFVAVESAFLDAAIAEHIDAFRDNLSRKGKSPDYYEPTHTRLTRIADGCGWATLRQIAPADLETYLAKLTDEGLSPKTVNDYLAAAKSFVRWCIRTRRLAVNPLERLEPISYARGENDKAALSVEQAERLLASSTRHQLLYLVALRTGLRRSELKNLEWGDIRIGPGVQRPHIALRAAVTKARRADTIPLHEDVAQELLNARPGNVSPNVRVFGSMPKMWTFRADLDRAGIPHTDERGKKICFHSLRVSFGTWLAQAGTAPRTHMELMRHTDMKLTMSFYTDPRLLDTHGAVNVLPSFNGRKEQKNPAVQLRTGTDDMPVETPTKKVLRQRQKPTVSFSQFQSPKGEQDHKKTPINRGFSMKELGLEPRTYALKGRCSTN